MKLFDHLRSEIQLQLGTADLAELFSEIEIQRVDIYTSSDSRFHTRQFWLFGRDRAGGKRRKIFSVEAPQDDIEGGRERAIAKASGLSRVFDIPFSDHTRSGDFDYSAPQVGPPPPSLQVEGRAVFYRRNANWRSGVRIDHGVLYTTNVLKGESPNWDYGRDLAHVRQVNLRYPALGCGLQIVADYASEGFGIPGRLSFDGRIWLRDWLHAEALQILKSS